MWDLVSKKRPHLRRSMFVAETMFAVPDKHNPVEFDEQVVSYKTPQGVVWALQYEVEDEGDTVYPVAWFFEGFPWREPPPFVRDMLLDLAKDQAAERRHNAYYASNYER